MSMSISISISMSMSMSMVMSTLHLRISAFHKSSPYTFPSAHLVCGEG